MFNYSNNPQKQNAQKTVLVLKISFKKLQTMYKYIIRTISVCFIYVLHSSKELHIYIYIYSLWKNGKIVNFMYNYIIIYMSDEFCMYKKW